MQYKRLFKYDPQCWMPSVEGHVICGHTDFVTSFLYFDTKSWTLIAYCALMANVSQLYEELISYADLYDSASFEAKKMIVSQLIRRVEVYRGYQIHVDFNFDLAQYLENSDELAC